MHDLQKAMFREAMEFLRERYGLFVSIDEPEWKRKLGSYWEQLRKHDWEDVRVALTRASEPDYYPDRFPTAGQVERVVAEVRSERIDRERNAARTEEKQSENEAAWERFHATPLSPEAQAEYIASARSASERVMREWECESRRLNLDPTKPTPRHIAERRMRQIEALLAGNIPTPAEAVSA